MTDDRMLRVMDRTVENLNNLKAGKPVQEVNIDFRDMMRGGGAQGGGQGNRGRRGG
jgi:hypothetical protein